MVKQLMRTTSVNVAAERTARNVPGGRMQKTLDLEHSSLLSQLETERQLLAKMRMALVSTVSAIREMESRDKSTMSDADFEQLTLAYERSDKLTADIEDIADGSDEVGYYIRTAGILFKYYDILEKGNGGTPCGAPASQPANASILKYFMNSSTEQSVIAKLPPSQQQASLSISDDRATLLERYMQSARCDGPTRHVSDMVRLLPHTPPSGGRGEEPQSATRSHEADACPHCGKRERTVMLQDGYVFCKVCHTVEYILVDHDKPSYKDPPKEIAYFAYKRINHLNEWLNQVQGKETTDIPDDVFDSILVEIKKQKLVNMAELTRKKVKDILKKLRINKYYEHIPHIINRLNGMPSPHMTSELEDRLRHMFCLIQVPFLKFSPSSRKNFLSYSYCLHKMMQLLEKDQYLDSFPLLKSREKLHQQDQIWRKICEDIGWDFIPSL